ncbi:MAG: xanthine dehydrogenase family protein subunit M [Candidatus Rokubacteria bacterium]|nr:xanthine dehydrogenase family protein subunit M [Candidatus Rokubacteria bacterium]MBI2015183.1 xanthine dehydrogenase family protein subunit M [Candidatus Rokubacteria bacterium]MBI2155936.1 xanthine dehydrogenase family protein subunit M [Candidatus Rokubacteria bacterium]MBI2494124.1 xanthine dehydrogenase family protein subunit M [Candidatus Rokubacteria bacterium]MBI4253981.1 xanthine dehydrogenase family protein subunit M [Candidatus Rokubacteria bacterium]
MKPAPFEYVTAETTEAAVAALERFEGNARCLAGGQSLVPLLNMRLLRPAAVIDLNRLSGLDHVTVDDGRVRVGALVRYSTLETSALVAERIPLLARAVPFVGDRQIRNRGTLGGALCHADPAGEMALAAVTLGASLRAVGPDGVREVPADDFFQGPYTTALAPAEVLTEVAFLDGRGAVAAVAEHARRHGDFAIVAIAAAGLPGPGDSWRWVRIGLGGVAPRPLYAARASALLAGTRLEPKAVRAAAEACLADADPASDIRASAEYRRHLIPVFVERVLAELRERRRGGTR